MSSRFQFQPVTPTDPAARTGSAKLPSADINSELAAEPELRLMAMILEDAMNCYLRFSTATSSAARREYRDAERWLFSERSDWIYSCENICSHLGVAPSFMRAQLRARSAAQRSPKNSDVNRSAP